MADLWSLSSPDSSDDSAAVEDLIAQAIDLSSLEQIAALNLSLVSDSVLPTDLETRFRRLKSFPGAGDLNPRGNRKPKSPKQSGQTPGEEAPSFSDDHRKSSNGSRKSLGCSSPDSEIENCLSEGLNAEKDRDPKSKPGSFSSPSISSSSSMGAAPRSPPRQTCCCFWCSPKRVSRKKSKEKRDLGDLSSFPLKDHQRKMEKILKEQEKMISREAEKVLKLVKQASAK